jgi:hypothetical protein
MCVQVYETFEFLRKLFSLSNRVLDIAFLAGHQWLVLIILATEIRKITVSGQPGQILCETPISKIARAKWTGGVAQAVEHLLCECEALSSNPSPTKTQNKSLPLLP